MARPPLSASRWVEERIAADPHLLDGRKVGGKFRRNVADLYPDWLSRVEAETGYPQVDGPRGFRKVVENAVRRIHRNGSNGNGTHR